MANYNAYYPAAGHYYNPGVVSQPGASYANYNLPTQQLNQQQQPSMIWVNSDKEAEMYPVAPNTAITLWNTSDPVVYLKQADATGRPTIKVFDLVERQLGTQSNAQVNDYAEKSELTILANNLKESNDHVAEIMSGFTDTIEKLKSEVETIKGDMYGIAGKKRATKKAEVEDV